MGDQDELAERESAARAHWLRIHAGEPAELGRPSRLGAGPVNGDQLGAEMLTRLAAVTSVAPWVSVTQDEVPGLLVAYGHARRGAEQVREKLSGLGMVMEGVTLSGTVDEQGGARVVLDLPGASVEAFLALVNQTAADPVTEGSADGGAAGKKGIRGRWPRR